MESYPAVAPLWDLSQPSSFSQLPDDDFLALLQKQFSTTNDGFNPGVFDTGINPQSIQSPDGPSPPSDDSSPSPPSVNNDSNSKGESRRPRADTDGDDSILKRKASIDSMSDGPNQKNQHTDDSDRRNSMSGRRKLSNGNPDESRLLKRKEQNRAAQRAFRERKEKHVKDLEDKVAALEAKNELANSENVNLRDLLARLQDENISLKQAAFTFSVSKTAGSDQPVASGSGHSSLNLTNSPTAMVSAPMSSFSVAPTVSSSDALVSPQIMDWTSLTTFDPAVLNLLDDTLPQTTATDSAMNMDFGFGGQSNKSPFTTIAANPMLMSFADFDSSPDLSGSDNSIGSFNFDMWTNSPQPDAATTMGEPGLDELFGGNYLNKPSPVDFNSFMHGNSPLSTSPIPHPSPGAGDSRSSTSSTSNNSESQSPVSSVGTSVESERVHGSCPRSRDETLKLIESQGQSPFVTEPNLSRRDPVLEKIVPCDGSGLPKTEPRADNVEVLAAWHDLTTNYKDYDINELCSEFTKKARCDGSRVVLEHPSYQDILAKLEQSQRQ